MEEILELVRDNVDVLKITGSFVSGGVVLWLWQALSGHFFVNLSIQLELRRTPSNSPGFHDLVTLVKLKKGDRATLALDEIAVWLVTDGHEPRKVSLLSEQPLCDIKSEVIERPLNITPGEETHFAYHHAIPQDCTYLIVARVMRKAVMGKRWRRAVWIASEISTPYLKEAIPKTMPNSALDTDARQASLPRAD